LIVLQTSSKSDIPARGPIIFLRCGKTKTHNFTFAQTFYVLQ
jgi:hypothetical protein